MATTVNTTTVSSANALTNLHEYTAATVSTVGVSETFKAPVSAADGNFFIIIDNTANNSLVTCTLVDSEFGGTIPVKRGHVSSGMQGVMFVESASCKNDGCINFQISPSASGNLNNVKVGVVQFLPVVNN